MSITAMTDEKTLEDVEYSYLQERQSKTCQAEMILLEDTAHIQGHNRHGHDELETIKPRVAELDSNVNSRMLLPNTEAAKQLEVQDASLFTSHRTQVLPPSTSVTITTTMNDQSHEQITPNDRDGDGDGDIEAALPVPTTTEGTANQEGRTYTYLTNRSSLFKLAFICTTCTTQLIAQAQFVMIIFPLHQIGFWLGTDDRGELSWMAASYGLTFGITVIASGRMGDLYGPKLIWTIGTIVIILSNLGSGFCKTPIPFDICRALSGIGAALSLLNVLAILGRIYPPGHMRHVVFAILGALAPAGFWLGGAIGAIFAEWVDVRWIWWFTAIFASIFLVVGLSILPSDDKPSTPTSSNTTTTTTKSKGFDCIGALLLVIAMGIFNFVWNQSSIVSWSKTYIYVLLIISIFAFGVFFLWERKVGDERALIPLQVLSKQSLLVYLSLWLGWMSLGIYLFYTSLFIYDIRGYHSPLTIAAQLFPLMPGGIVAALTVPYLITRYSGHIIFLAAMVSFLLGSVITATTPVHGIYWGNTFWSAIVIVFGPDLSFSTGQLIVSNSVNHESQGIAAGIVSMITNYSLSIGLGMAGTVERSIRLSAQSRGFGEVEITLRGYKSAFYPSVGFSALAVVVVGLFVRMPKQVHPHGHE